MSKLADYVIIGSDENRKYLDFWPHVAYAYRTIFPGVKVCLALVTERTPSDPLIKELEKHGEVATVRPVQDYPIASQAKMARFLVATTRAGHVCYIDDLDVIPIDHDWHIEKVQKRPIGALLLIGREVYGTAYPNQVPASMMTAEGHVFARLFNFAHVADHGIKSWYDYLHALRVDDEDHTNIKLPTFSDEALIVRLRQENPVIEQHVERGYVTGRNTIDRAYWPYNIHHLRAGGYLTVHTARPYLEFKRGNDEIIKYIRDRYNGGPLPEPLS